MKVSMALEVLILLVALTWSHAEKIYVKISCSLDWVMVSVSPCAYNRYILSEELSLGSGCPVTRIQTYIYDFVYSVHDCGVRTKVISEYTLLIQTELHYIPINTHWDSETIPLECLTSRKSVWLIPVSTEDEIKVDPSPFMTDFETTPEEIGLLSDSLVKEKWKTGNGLTKFARKTKFFSCKRSNWYQPYFRCQSPLKS
ncbi:oocyte-secreted protein 2 [Talpa occidentalis]|uniref:oocyte-secreted protein 2 n=1 Tax=Talpa occidentalis TaxID=50954 RepID=UPI00188F1194|nr:oocyte-secreted protein 2 [Talpa occidentalis]